MLSLLCHYLFEIVVHLLSISACEYEVILSVGILLNKTSLIFYPKALKSLIESELKTG